MKPHHEPEALSLWSQGWGARHVIWDSKTRVFICGSGGLPSDRSERKSHPSAKDWSLFWRIVDNLDAWAWGGNHTTQFICDGGDWFLSIQHQGRSLEAQGIYLNKLPRFFDLFERSINALAGISALPPLDHLIAFGVHAVERLDELLALAEAVRTGQAFRTFGSGRAVDSTGACGPTCHGASARVLALVERDWQQAGREAGV